MIPDLTLEKNTGGCFVFTKDGLPIIYRGCMNEYLDLDNAPVDIQGEKGDPHRYDAHYLQSNDKQADIKHKNNRIDIIATPSNADKSPGNMKCQSTYQRAHNGYHIICSRKWLIDEKNVGDDSICFLFAPGICSYWSIRDPIPNTTTAQIRFDYPWTSWPDGLILPEVVKTQAKIQNGSSAFVVGPVGGAILIVEKVSGEPLLRCVYPRGRGYHEIELTWPSGKRSAGRCDTAQFHLMLL